MERDWRRAGVELSLDEVMSEPIVHLLMRRDGLTPENVWLVVEAVRRRQQRASAANNGSSGTIIAARQENDDGS